MTYTPGISFLGTTNTQISRLKQLNTTLIDLQRQLTTQKKFDNISGFGAQAYSIQKLRTDNTQISAFLNNIAEVTTRIELMSSAMQQSSDAGRMVADAVGTFYTHGGDDTDTVSLVARQQLDLMRDVINQEIDGRYLFSGTATDEKPLSNFTQLNMNMQNLVSDWQSGTLTTAQLIAAVDALSDTDLGFNPALSSAGKVTSQIDKNHHLDYTSIATQNGMRDIVRGLALAANLSAIDPALSPPGPAQSDMDDLMRYIKNAVDAATNTTDRNNVQMGAMLATAEKIEEQHQIDTATYDKILIEKENVDPTEVVAKLQTLQTQISASYEVTSMVSQLSLINYL